MIVPFCVHNEAYIYIMYVLLNVELIASTISIQGLIRFDLEKIKTGFLRNSKQFQNMSK